MKKILAIAFASAALAVSASDYIYWQVTDPVYNNEAVDFTYATVSTDNGATYLNIYNPGTGEAESSPYVRATFNSTSPVYAGEFDSSATLRFDLWYEATVGDPLVNVGWATYAYSELSNFIYSDRSTSGASAFNLTSVVPEPTSGLLSLLGLTVLALRRKRA